MLAIGIERYNSVDLSDSPEDLTTMPMNFGKWISVQQIPPKILYFLLRNINSCP